MHNNHIIGGEFDIDIRSLRYTRGSNDLLSDVYKFSSGRSALYYILQDVQHRYSITTLYLPDYLCSSIVFAAEKSQMGIIFYSVDGNLEIDPDKFPMKDNEASAVLLINYFGLKNLQSQVNLVRSISEKAIIIEDDVQAFYEFQKSDIQADYKFTSLRKMFPCPDGGLVMTRNELPFVTEINKFHQYKLAGGILKSMNEFSLYDDSVYLQLFEKGELLIDGEIAMGMSRFSQESIAKIDLDETARIRRRNARIIHEGLATIGVQTILSMPDESVPLCIPIWLDDRNKVRARMFSKQIFCPVHWPIDGLKVNKGMQMAEHEMSIVIDQRYSDRDMDFILTTLESALK